MPDSTEFVATLIAGNKGGLTPEILARAAKDAGRTAWLAEGEAADIFVAGSGTEALYAQFRKALGDAPVDVIVQPAAARVKKLLLADMESTIIEQEILDELGEIVGIGDKIAGITRRAMNGELDFAAALRERVGLLKGKPAKILDEAARRITLTPGAAALLGTMRKNGARAWLVTGGFTYFAQPVADRLGFNDCFANNLVIKDGMITGVVSEPIFDRNGKKDSLLAACRKLGLQPSDCLGIGDGANDVPMLSACNQGSGLGVAFQAKPKVRAAIPHQINYGNLTALLYAQGYRKEDFISSFRT